MCMRFWFDPSSTAFLHRCVFDEKAQSISVDRRPKNVRESLSFTYTTNVRFKLRISGNRKSADKNDLKQPLLSNVCYRTKPSHFVFAILFTRFTAKVTHIRRLLYQVSFSGLRPLTWQHRIFSQTVILSFLIIFS